MSGKTKDAPRGSFLKKIAYLCRATYRIVINEEPIFVAFRSGELDLFYRELYPGLVLFALSLLGKTHEHLAEDCAQDAILKAWERRRSFDSIYALKSFLFLTMRNDAISLFRKNHAWQRYLKQLEDPVFFQNYTIDQEAGRLVYGAIAGLPEKMREVFELNFFEGMKLAEIAEKMGLSESSVKKYKASALDLLREKLDPDLFAGILFHVLF